MKIEELKLDVEEIKEEKVITFEEGIPGFENLTKFVILENQATATFMYLQSLEDEAVCFVITNPYHFKKDYAPVITEGYFEKLGGGKDEEFAIYAITCIKDPVYESTLNLAGPILIQTKYLKGIQVVTEENEYCTKHKIIDLLQG